jgi:hypothetical protein
VGPKVRPASVVTGIVEEQRDVLTVTAHDFRRVVPDR